MVAVVDVATLVVVMVKVAETEPAGTKTVEPTWANPLLDERPIATPPVGALPESVTVPVELVPPSTVLGDNVKLRSTAGLIVRLAVFVIPAADAVIVAVTELATEVVVTVKLADVAPAGMVMVAGTVALLLLDERFTTNPPAGAALKSATVPLDSVPPTTGLGEIEIPFSPDGVTVSVVVLLVLPCTAEMVTAVEVETAVVVTAKFADVAPAGTVTVAGTNALALLEERFITEPPDGAPVNRVTVPVAEAPPTTELGDTDTLDNPGGLIDSDAVFVTPLRVAEIVEFVAVDTEVVVTKKLAEEEPAAIVIDAGRLAGELAVKVTVTPPDGAALDKVTVPVDEDPPTTDVGAKVTLERLTGLIESVAVLVTPLKEAVIVDDVADDTGVVVTLKLADERPAGTVTEAGTPAPDVAESKTVTPPVGAAAASATVPVEELPPTTEFGDRDTLESAGAAFTVNGAVTV